MNRTTLFKVCLTVAALACLPVAQATSLSKADYDTAKQRIGTVYATDKSSCESRADNARDICNEEATARQKVALAELEYGYTRKASDMNRVKVAKAEGTYAVAKERCDDRAGNDKDVCVKEAQAAQTRALAEARMDKQVGAAVVDATQDVLDAEYAVAAQKCDALAGDAKSSCVDAAKTRYNKR